MGRQPLQRRDGPQRGERDVKEEQQPKADG